MVEAEKTSNKVLDKIQKLPIIGDQPKNEKEEKYLREICEYEFYNIKEVGVATRFPYGSTKNNHKFTLFHGGKYKLPRFIARYIESRATPLWDWRPDGLGSLKKTETGTDSRFQMRQTFGG